MLCLTLINIDEEGCAELMGGPPERKPRNGGYSKVWLKNVNKHSMHPSPFSLTSL